MMGEYPSIGSFIKFTSSQCHKLTSFHFSVELNWISSNLHLQSHKICFATIFDLFIPVIILKIYKFTSSVLLWTHMLDRSSRVLQLLSKLTINRY